MKGNKIFDFSRVGFQDIINIMTKKINECVDISNEMFPRLQDYISKIDWNKIINSDLYEEVLSKLKKTSEQLETNTDVIKESGLERLKATSKFITSLQSYIGLVNTAYKEDNATRFYLLPKAPVTSGVGGCLKIFADNYPDSNDYRDLGIYFHANQNGDKGYYGNGVNWFNVKVLDGSKYDNKYPDMGFSFQDGKVVAGRITCFNGSKPIWVFGGNKPVSQTQLKFYIAEFQDDVAFLNDKGLYFLKADKNIGGSLRVNSNGDMVFSNSKSELHTIGGNTIMSITDNKVQFEKSTYHNSNIAFNSSSNGVVLKSPNGTQYKIKVSDDGILSTERI